MCVHSFRTNKMYEMQTSNLQSADQNEVHRSNFHGLHTLRTMPRPMSYIRARQSPRRESAYVRCEVLTRPRFRIRHLYIRSKTTGLIKYKIKSDANIVTRMHSSANPPTHPQPSLKKRKRKKRRNSCRFCGSNTVYKSSISHAPTTPRCAVGLSHLHLQMYILESNRSLPALSSDEKGAGLLQSGALPSELKRRAFHGTDD
jgi:hypothetical protein